MWMSESCQRTDANCYGWGDLNKQRIVRAWRRHVPELFSVPGRILYVGACVRHFTGARELVEAGNELTVVEVWDPFLDELMADGQSSLVAHAVVGDVRTLDPGALPHDHYEYAVFCHGPEHLPAQDAGSAVERLQGLADVVVLATPDGWMPNPANRGNPYTEHQSSWRVSDFRAWENWQAVTDGEDIVAWWRQSGPQPARPRKFDPYQFVMIC